MLETRHEPPDPSADRFRLRPGEILGIIAFWAFLAALTATGRLLDPRLPERPETTSAFIALAFIEYAIWAVLTFPIIRLVNSLSRDSEGQWRNLAIFVAVGFIVAIGVDTLLGAFRRHLLPFPPPRFVLGPWGNLVRFGFLDDLLVYFAVLGAAMARHYFLRYQARVDETRLLRAETAELEARLAEAQLAVLRTQLNPHFLFNTLHAISSLVERDPKGVRRMIARLSELLRHTLDQSAEQEVPLERELELLQRYLDIMEVRFQGKLEVTVRIDERVRDALVPNLILQPLVENALKHGVSATEEAGRVEVQAHREDGDIVLMVRDNGPGLSPTSNSKGVGLRNTIARLEQLYGPKQRFALRAAEGGGTIAEVRLPYHTQARQ
jgi:two-component system, LytTR family, sensor kinase